MKTMHLDPTAGDQAASVVEEVDKLLREGKQVAVTVAEEQELLSPQQAGLYRCRDVDDPELLLSWAPDLPADHADGPLRMLREAGIDVPEGELQEMAPEWAG